MTDFTYDNTVPATNNSPSLDQPKMSVNAVSLGAIWDQDHIGFNANNGGTHLFNTYINNPNYITPIPAVSGLGGLAYTAAGTASPLCQYFLKNSTSTVMLSALRAFGNFTFTVAGSLITINNQYNIASITVSGANPYSFTITLNTGVTTTNFAIVLYNSQSGGFIAASTLTYGFSNNILTLNTPTLGGAITTLTINFAIIQA